MGLKIRVYMPSIGSEHEEWLIHQEVLTKSMKDKGFEKVFISSFTSEYDSKFDKLSLGQKTLTTLNMKFMFKKL